MTPKIKELYKHSLKDKEFLNEMKEDDPDNYMEPTIFWSNNQKTGWAAMYYGWLVGKGKRKNKNNEKK